MSVDGTDFRIQHAGRKFYSYKYKASGLRYEVAVCILSGECVWINGPFEPGMYNDIMIFCSALLGELEEGERVEADDGYNGEAPHYVKCPRSIVSWRDTEEQQSIVRRQQETINKCFKQFGLLKQVFRHDIMDHGDCFRAIAIITQLSIQNGEPLFSVEYRDPYLDDNYFPEAEDDEDSDGSCDDNSSVGGRLLGIHYAEERRPTQQKLSHGAMSEYNLRKSHMGVAHVFFQFIRPIRLAQWS